MSRILSLNGVSIDGLPSSYVVLGATGPLVARQKRAIAGLGVDILEYMDRDAYLCASQLADLAPLRALPFVAWAEIYALEAKLAPALLAESPPGPRRVDVVFHRDVDPWTILYDIANAAGVDPDILMVSRRKVRLTLPARRLVDIAKVDGVRHIEPVAPRTLHGGVAEGARVRATVGAMPRALEGHGEIVAVCDTGLDRGSVTPGELHVAFSGRVARLYALGRVIADDPHGHGTHVCGSLLGDGTYAPGEGASPRRLRGAAPRATLVMQSVLDSQGGLGGLPADLHDLFGPPYYCDGARIHSNSWGDEGTSSRGLYTQSCRELDDFVWEQRDMVIVVAAGNDGEGPDGVAEPGSVTPPSTSKNCIAVGASESYARTAAFSSRGPTRDGRYKPDVIAPGTAILSTRSRAQVGTHGGGTTHDPNYGFDGGTSMATPLVSGCVALIREHVRKAKGHDYAPSAALLKALLIDGAQRAATPPRAGTPSFTAGFGRVDLPSTIDAIHQTLAYWDEGPALDTGEEWAFSMELPGAVAALKVTLVWTDFPGEVLQNDLDLIVRADGRESHGNMPFGSTEFDRKNNVEQVVLGALPAGKLELVVRAHRVAIGPQTFALVARTL